MNNPKALEALEEVVSVILPQVYERRGGPETGPTGPFVLGLSGLQGSGKSTWAAALVDTFAQKGVRAVTLSLDDLYLDHRRLIALRNSNPQNELLEHRGQPGTHDEVLSQQFFAALRAGSDDLLLPAFDKSKFDGEGDRRPVEQWARVNEGGRPEILVFEGWCLGFQPLEQETLKAKWLEAQRQEDVRTAGQARVEGRQRRAVLGRHTLENVFVVNENLRRYCNTFMGPEHFDALIQLDTDSLNNVYRWRLDQEHRLREVRGAGMTDAEVVRFVDGYMPSYELYLEQLQQGLFFSQQNMKSQKTLLRVVLGSDRAVLKIETS